MKIKLFVKKGLHDIEKLPAEAFAHCRSIGIREAGNSTARVEDMKLPGRENILLSCLSFSIMLSYLSSLSRLPLERVVRRCLPVNITPFSFPSGGRKRICRPQGKAQGAPTFALQLYTFKPVRGKTIPRAVAFCGNQRIKDNAGEWGLWDLSAITCYFILCRHTLKQHVRIYTLFSVFDSSADSCFFISAVNAGNKVFVSGYNRPVVFMATAAWEKSLWLFLPLTPYVGDSRSSIGYKQLQIYQFFLQHINYLPFHLFSLIPKREVWEGVA
ncbi:hypothetical protein D0T84_10210 [Dysgonomonas sp. 521]|nr:hypothetical protein [Dysgonomonas sp. 521]